MRPKILYILFAVFLIVIFISVLINIWINTENVKIKPYEKKAASQQAMIGTGGLVIKQATQSTSASLPRSAITVIKSPSQEKAVLVLEEKEKKTRKSLNSPSLAAQNPPISQSASSDLTDRDTSGITKINKRPTEVERKEMNERGIVIW
jgi:hypothetical protein